MSFNWNPLAVNTGSGARPPNGRPNDINIGIKGLLDIISHWSSGPGRDLLTTPPELLGPIRQTQIWPVFEALQPLKVRLAQAEYAFKGVHSERTSEIASPVDQILERLDGAFKVSG